eukprot:scaffold24252_cov67-Isochrysis_galbana.AAC.1
MELLMRNHTATLVELDTPVLKHICTSLQAGLKSHEVAISSQCAAALEHLAAFHFNATSDDRDSAVKVSKHRTKPTAIGPFPPSYRRARAAPLPRDPFSALAAHLAREPELFSSQLAVLLNMIVFEDCANQWSLSRPLLALILSNPAYFASWKQSILQQQVCTPSHPADPPPP